MIKGKGRLPKMEGLVNTDEFNNVCAQLQDNSEYLFVIYDETRNRNLPILSYLFSVVLSYISQSLPDKPSTTALYKYFEDMFAPIHRIKINGEQFEYCELKTERVSDVGNVVESIVEYARTEWGIEVPTQADLKDPEMRELHSQAYLNQKIDWSNFISSRQKLSKDERRNKKD